MILGIVGSEQIKFTPITEEKARIIIRQLIKEYNPTLITSGECHLGGVDIFTKEESKNANIQFLGYPPNGLEWKYYKSRNLKIARKSDIVICITVVSYPSTYNGMKFIMCYHCGTDKHIKSGGCWTVKKAIEMGKLGKVIAV